MIETEDIRLSQERLAALKELLTPIKDVAKSWNVDISLELEKYMSQFGDNLNSENFAEAALVIQGSAGVWGKKVDYLFSLVVDSKTIIDTSKERKNKNTDEREGEDTEDDMMVLPPFQVKKAANPFIDLDSVCVSRHWKPNLPLCLSATLVKNDNPENMLYNKKGELLASIDDFFMHRIAAYDRNGFASIDIDSYHLARKHSDKAAVTPFYKRRVSQFNSAQDHETNLSVDKCNAAAAVSEGGEVDMIDEDIPQSDDPGYPDDPGDPGGALDLDDESDGDADPPEPTSLPNRGINEPKTPMHSISSRSNSQLPTQCDAPVQQMVHLLDPYEEVPSKPFKKGTITKPRTSSKRKTQTSSESSLSQFLESNSKPARPTNFYNILRKPIYPENTELFKKLRRKEASNANRMKKKITRQPHPVLLPDDLFKPPTIIEQSDGDDHDFGGGDDNFADNHTVLDNAQSGEDLGPSNNLEYLENQQEEELRASVTQPVVSYEDLVRQNVLKFTQQAGNRYRASELRTRVIEWENRITPLLEEEEKDPPFDVCIYSNKVISKLSSCADEQATLKDLVLGESKGEVCRLFLTSLMLTNSSNIELLGSDDKAKCKLLSRTLFSDVLEGYVASETDATGSLNRKRKNLPP